MGHVDDPEGCECSDPVANLLQSLQRARARECRLLRGFRSESLLHPGEDSLPQGCKRAGVLRAAAYWA